MRFVNYDGKTYDIDDSRSSVAVAAGVCVRFFDAAGYGGAESVLYCSTTNATAYLNIGSFDNRASAMRSCPNATRTQCNKTPTAPAPAPPGSSPPPAAEEDPIVAELAPTGSGEGVEDSRA